MWNWCRPALGLSKIHGEILKLLPGHHNVDLHALISDCNSEGYVNLSSSPVLLNGWHGRACAPPQYEGFCSASSTGEKYHPHSEF